MVECPMCKGKGIARWEAVVGGGALQGICPHCDGEGEVSEWPDPDDPASAVVVEARAIVAAAWNASGPCRTCHRSGAVRVYRSGKLDDYILRTCNDCRVRIAA